MAKQPRPKTTFRFDSKTPAAVRAAERQAARMVKEVTKETEKNIRLLISKAISDGIPPREAAQAIKATIGLTSGQGQAVLKYREQLLDMGSTLDAVDSLVETYANKLLNSRAENIARTEIMDALNEGKEESFLQAQEEGYLSANATKELILDPDACEICLGVEPKVIPLDDEFEEGGPPFHPRCRCTVVIGTP